jgi:DNA polymerase
MPGNRSGDGPVRGGPGEWRQELATLAGELRAHAEWQKETGVTGVAPRKDRAPARSAERAGARSEVPRAPRSAAPPSPVGDFPGSSPVGDFPGSSPVGDFPGSSVAAPSSVLPARPGDAKRRLLELATEIRTCQKCALHAARTQTVFARGNPEAELCFIGEGPGADEDEQGFPFVGKAGQLLDRMIVAMGFSPDDVYVCNIVKCRPPQNRKPEPGEMRACTPYLREQLELVSPKVMVALGATAVEGLLGVGGGITQIRGHWKLYRGIPVMPTFHPAYLLRTPSAKREVWADLQAVLKQLGRPLPPAGRSA